MPVLAGLVLALSISSGLLLWNLGKAKTDIGRLEATAEQLRIAVVDNYAAVNELDSLLKECVGDRVASEQATRAAEALIQELRESIADRVNNAQEEIRNEMEALDVGRSCHALPPRTSRLLIEAATRANRAADRKQAGVDSSSGDSAGSVSRASTADN